MEFGGCKPGTTITVDTKLLHYSQLTIKGVYHTTPKHVGMAFELIKRGEFPEELMINKSFKLDKALDELLSILVLLYLYISYLTPNLLLFHF